MQLGFKDKVNGKFLHVIISIISINFIHIVGDSPDDLSFIRGTSARTCHITLRMEIGERKIIIESPFIELKGIYNFI